MFPQIFFSTTCPVHKKNSRDDWQQQVQQVKDLVCGSQHINLLSLGMSDTVTFQYQQAGYNSRLTLAGRIQFPPYTSGPDTITSLHQRAGYNSLLTLVGRIQFPPCTSGPDTIRSLHQWAGYNYLLILAGRIQFPPYTSGPDTIPSLHQRARYNSLLTLAGRFTIPSLHQRPGYNSLLALAGRIQFQPYTQMRPKIPHSMLQRVAYKFLKKRPQNFFLNFRDFSKCDLFTGREFCILCLFLLP